MKKVILTPKRAEEIQSEIYSRMSAKERIHLTSMLFTLTKKLKESKTVSNDSGRIIGKNN